MSTRYLPSNILGGDSFDFYWLDDDHMVVTCSTYPAMVWSPP